MVEHTKTHAQDWVDDEVPISDQHKDQVHPNNHLDKERMSVEKEHTRHEQQVSCLSFEYTESISDWIDRLEDILGTAYYVLRDEETPGVLHQAATYFLPHGVVGEPNFHGNHVSLNIIHPLAGKRRHFRVNVRIVRDGEQILHSYPNITRITIDGQREIVYLFDATRDDTPFAELDTSGSLRLAS